MRSRGIRIFTLLPGARRLRPLLARFCDGGYGIVTAASEPPLAVARALLPEESGVDVEPFGAFVQGLLARLDVPGGNLVHSGHYIAAIAEACLDLPEDSPFWRTRKFRGVHRRMADCLKELAHYRIDLQAGLPSLSPELEPRVRDLAKIEEGAREALAVLGKQTHAEQIELLLPMKAKRADLPGRVLVLVDAELSPLQVDLLGWLGEAGASIWLVSPPCLNHAFEWSARLQEGDEQSADASLPSLDDHEEARPVQASSSDNGSLPWYAGGDEPRPCLTFSSSADLMAECELTVAECKRQLDEGTPLSSLGIYVRDLGSYSPMLISAAEHLQVPLSCPRRVPLMSNALVRLVLGVMKALAGNDVRELSVLVQSSYAALAPETRSAAIDSLRDAHRRRAGAWQSLSDSLAEANESLRWIGEILRWRSDALGALRPLEGWVQELRRLLPLLPRAEDLETGLRDQRAASVMQRSLFERASLTRLRDREAIDLRAFARICADVWEDADVSIPTSEHGVAVSAVPKLLWGRRRIFALGLVEGVFPRRRREDPILSDQSRRELSEAFHLAEPLRTSLDDPNRELEAFYELCAEAAEELDCSYPRMVDDRDNAPSSYFEALQKLAGDAGKVIDHPRAMPTAMEPPLSIDEPAISPPLAIQMTFQPWELRDALECGFHHYARHRLGLRKGDFASHWNRLRSIRSAWPSDPSADRDAAHESLEFGLKEHLDKQLGNLPSWELPLLLAGGRRLISEWVGREFAAREKWPKDFGSESRDVAFGRGLRADLRKGLLISGRVEATSRMGEYAIVHLVESHTPEPKGGELSDAETLYYGLYLMAISSQATSAGVEIEGMDGKRVLMVVPKLPGTVLPSDARESIQFVGLGTDEDPYDVKRRFYERVKELLDAAVSRIRDGDVVPRPGPHCRACDYGELCRKSSDFGEEASLFDDPILAG